MTWFCAKTIGHENVALAHLARAGLTTFRPEVHRYFRNRYHREQRRIANEIPGYIFVRLWSPEDMGRAEGAIGVKYLLGSMEHGVRKPREIEAGWIMELMRCGPRIEGKKMAFKKGAKVKRAVGALADIIGEVEGVDTKGPVTLSIEMFGAMREVRISAERLELAE